MRGELPPSILKIDAEALIEELTEHHGIEPELLGTAGGGEVGAAFILLPDGREGVLTRAGDASAETARHLRTTAEVLQFARSRGLPVPQYLLIAAVGQAHVVVQERLPGAAPETVDTGLAEDMVRASEPWEGLLAGWQHLAAQSLYLTESGPGYCLHDSLEHYDRRTRQLLHQVREIGHVGPGELQGEDLVHLDHHAGNVLVGKQGELTGIVDWDGWARGDRWFALETLTFDLAGRGADPALIADLTIRIEAVVPPQLLQSYRAHLALRQVDWSIRHHDPATVDRWLHIVANRL